MNGLFMILGVGVDDAFVIMDGVLPLCDRLSSVKAAVTQIPLTKAAIRVHEGT